MSATESTGAAARGATSLQSSPGHESLAHLTPHDDLSGAKFLVTGAASGIGRETAIQLGTRGAKVVLADRDLNRLESTATTIEALGGEARTVRAEIADEKQVERMVEDAISAFDGLDGAFNNAGIAAAGSYSFGTALTEINLKDFREILDINVVGMFLCLKRELRRLQPGASIVNNASAAGLIGVAKGAAYGASKHGAIGLTKAAALEGAPRGIRVNAVCPGYVGTPMLLNNATDEGKRARVAQTPLGRLGRPSEVAALAIWLLSPASSFMTGACIPVDGGLSAGVAPR